MRIFLDSLRARLRAGSVVLALGLAATGCAGQWPTVELAGTPRDLAQLVGRWSGEYVSDAPNDPGGSIVFILEAVGERARGDVIMKRRGADRPYGRYDPEGSSLWSLGTAQNLSIQIVRASDGWLNGELDRYWDLDCDCIARTRFRGEIRANVIEGTYETRFEGLFVRRTGRWRVLRTDVALLHER